MKPVGPPWWCDFCFDEIKELNERVVVAGRMYLPGRISIRLHLDFHDGCVPAVFHEMIQETFAAIMAGEQPPANESWRHESELGSTGEASEQEQGRELH